MVMIMICVVGHSGSNNVVESLKLSLPQALSGQEMSNSSLPLPLCTLSAFLARNMILVLLAAWDVIWIVRVITSVVHRALKAIKETGRGHSDIGS